MGFGNSAADELIAAADDFVDLAEREETFLL
jgi:uncharacterized LabA/DUF88 family protein